MDKSCKECGQTKPTTEFHKDRSKPDGLNFYCKPCARIRLKRFMMRPPRKTAPEGMKRCPHCKSTKALEHFGRSTQTYDGLDRRCKACNASLQQAWRLKNLDKSAAYMRQYRKNNLAAMQESERKRSHGVEPGWYAKTLASQGGGCAICHTTTAGGRGSFHVDHCHASGKIRSLLCHACNLAIGNMRDNPDIAESARQYLLKHKVSEEGAHAPSHTADQPNADEKAEDDSMRAAKAEFKIMLP